MDPVQKDFNDGDEFIAQQAVIMNQQYKKIFAPTKSERQSTAVMGNTFIGKKTIWVAPTVDQSTPTETPSEQVVFISEDGAFRMLSFLKMLGRRENRYQKEKKTNPDLFLDIYGNWGDAGDIDLVLEDEMDAGTGMFLTTGSMKNGQLAIQRAKLVKAELKKRGVANDRIKAQAGESGQISAIFSFSIK